MIVVLILTTFIQKESEHASVIAERDELKLQNDALKVQLADCQNEIRSLKMKIHRINGHGYGFAKSIDQQ
jgi:hypothetical protein